MFIFKSKLRRNKQVKNIKNILNDSTKTSVCSNSFEKSNHSTLKIVNAEKIPKAFGENLEKY